MSFMRATLRKGTRVLLLEDSQARIDWFTERVPDLTVVRTFSDFRQHLVDGLGADFIFLDHDLGPVSTQGDGQMAAFYLRETFGSGGRATLIHSWNRAGVNKMLQHLPEAVAVPFGAFELEVK